MRILLCLLTFLAACNTAGPGFMGIEPIRQEMDGSTFLIRLNGDLAEVIRTNAEMLPKTDVIAAKGARAVQAITGCEVAWVIGDAALMTMGLSCNGAPPPEKPKPKQEIDCEIDDYYGAGSYAEVGLSCTVYDGGYW